jgi:hypothetical protein
MDVRLEDNPNCYQNQRSAQQSNDQMVDKLDTRGLFQQAQQIEASQCSRNTSARQPPDELQIHVPVTIVNRRAHNFR